MAMQITLTMAGAATLINIWLAVRCGQVRMQVKVDKGDGGNAALIARMRAHSNFVEYTPFFLILLGLIEYAKGSALWLWIVSIAYLAARLLHAFGMDRPSPNALRMIGAAVTMLVLLILAGYALYLPYSAA